MKKILLTLVFFAAALLCAGCSADKRVSITATIHGQALDPKKAYDLREEEATVHVHVDTKQKIKEILARITYEGSEEEAWWDSADEGYDLDLFLHRNWEDVTEVLHVSVILPDDSVAATAEYRIYRAPFTEFEYEDWWGGVSITKYHGNVEVVEVPREIDGKPVLYIGREAFANHNLITEIILPDTVQGIDEYAFYNTWMHSITIPDTVESIGKGAFDLCARLKSFVWPACAPEVPDYAFSECEDLASVYLPQTVKKIGEEAFSCCPSLTEIQLPQGLREIGYGAFRGDRLKSIIIPDSVERIGEYCFHCNDLLETVQMSAHLRSLGMGAFSQCGALREITLPDSLTDVRDNPFPRCPSLEKINLSPNHPVLKIEDGVLYNTLEKILLYFPVQDNRASFAVPEGIRRIGGFAFSDMRPFSYAPLVKERLTSLTLPDTLEEIGDFSLRGCNFTELALPYGLRTIGGDAFPFKLRHLEMPDTVTYAEEGVFANLSDLQSVRLSEAIASLRASSFKYCSSLKKITLPQALRYIGPLCFYGCMDLEAVVVQGQLESIGSYAFSDSEETGTIIYVGQEDTCTIQYCNEHNLLYQVENR